MFYIIILKQYKREREIYSWGPFVVSTGEVWGRGNLFLSSRMGEARRMAEGPVPGCDGGELRGLGLSG